MSNAYLVTRRARHCLFIVTDSDSNATAGPKMMSIYAFLVILGGILCSAKDLDVIMDTDMETCRKCFGDNCKSGICKTASMWCRKSIYELNGTFKYHSDCMPGSKELTDQEKEKEKITGEGVDENGCHLEPEEYTKDGQQRKRDGEDMAKLTICYCQGYKCNHANINSGVATLVIALFSALSVVAL